MSRIAFKGNASGTGTFTFESPNSNTDRTLTLPDEAGTVLTSASDVLSSTDNISVQAAENTPAFQAILTSNQSVTTNTWTTIIFNSEDLDSNGFYDTSTGRFQPTIAGWYMIGSRFRWEGTGTNRRIISVWKNSNEFARISEFSYNQTAGEHQNSGGILVNFNGSTDYAYIRAFADYTGPVGAGDRTLFYGFLVRAI